MVFGGMWFGMWWYVVVCGGMQWYVVVCGGMWWYVLKSVTPFNPYLIKFIILVISNATVLLKLIIKSQAHFNNEM